jgi:lysyl-tRNA synthetase class 1
MKKINKDIYQALISWPFIEAKKIIENFGGLNNFSKPIKKYILFETGYGPSGLPHIGTFGEVVRTSMVKNAFEALVDCKAKLITFSDDMDGLRKIPDNVPNKNMLEKYIGQPLTSIPDPFEKYESFGHHNNAKLCSFLDKFKFEYEFVSSTNKYKSGDFDKTLTTILENYEEIISVILPTLRSERRQTYSPFLPISEVNGIVLQVKIEEYRPKTNSIIFVDPANNKKTEIEVTKGKCKLQWKVDWAMRWMSLDVDYEMCGKDLIESFDLASKICQVMKKKPPVNLIYEMFLDEKGEKISKSVGNGISVDQWLRYASPESLSFFMFQKPKSAKKLFYDVIPKSVDEYSIFLNKYRKNDAVDDFNNPVWHIHNGNPPKFKSEINFNSLMNLVNICNSTDKNVIWGFVKEYDNSLNPNDNPEFDKLIQYAINYYTDFIQPNKKYIKINDENKELFEDILNLLKTIDAEISSEGIQTQIYEIGKKYNFDNLRDYFKLVYQVLLGQEQGPRLGSFIKLYGINKTCKLLEDALKK